jgi:hypothetical protein
MTETISAARPRLTTLRAGAAAGIIFGTLFLICLILVRVSIPAGAATPASWAAQNSSNVDLALNLLPFAGIAFLWFIGVVRERIGALEDRFFATVFLGSGLLFLAMTFASGAMAGGILVTYAQVPDTLQGSLTYTFGRAATYELLNIYGLKMAGVFMIATSTIARRTNIVPRWMVVLGYILALVLLLSAGVIEWASVVLPLWVLMISLYILIEDVRGRPRQALAVTQ